MSALSQDPEHPDSWLIPDRYRDGQVIHTSTVIRNVHLKAACEGQVCLLHNPTPHHMRSWSLVWVDVQKIFARMCRHGVAHPDPDSWGDGQHPGSCDGCCLA